MIINLSEVEKELCNYLAVLRKKGNRAVNPVDAVAEFGLEADYVEREGVMSELAFCQLANVYPDQVFSIGHRSATKGEDDGDLTVNGICIDVKTTKHQTGRLVSFRKNPSVDLIVLMTGEEGCYRFVGGMQSEDMYQSYRWGIPNGMKQKCFSAVQQELMTAKQVMDYIF
jgi:hypothetical protein